MKDGGPAFPQHGFDPVAERFTSQGGMTLRDYFAGQALIGILARPAVDYRTTDELARQAHAVARAMLKERSKT